MRTGVVEGKLVKDVQITLFCNNFKTCVNSYICHLKEALPTKHQVYKNHFYTNQVEHSINS